MSNSTERPMLSVVVPAYNEEKKIQRDLGDIYAYLSRQSYLSEVLLVDDGSMDATLQRAKLLEQHPHYLQVVSYMPNRGKGHAVKTGMLQARGEFLLFMDAGSCVPMHELEKGLAMLREGYDVAIASRAIEGSQMLQAAATYRRLGGRVFKFLIRNFLGIRHVADTQCGFKLFRREAAHKIFSAQRTERMMFDLETVLNAKKFGYRLGEFPVAWTCDLDSRLTMGRGTMDILKDLLRIKFGRWSR